MDRSQRTVDSSELLQDWNKWLTSLEKMKNGQIATNGGLSQAASGLEQVADQFADSCLRKPLAEADRQAVAVKFDVYGLDDVLGFDHRRGNSVDLDLGYGASSGCVR